jgi:competence/damage-inducible protein CinA-like protein
MAPSRACRDGTLAGMPRDDVRRLLTAELLSIGSELTVGETRDTNAGELARSLSELGVRVARMTALPDDLEAVSAAFADGLARSDLVVSTGGLGPTPDDLTRESIAAACGEVPAPDPGLEAWLRELWARRGIPFPESNLKQAWLIPSATALANPNGTAPGWLVERPDGRIVVALPGPPREMRPMWADEALPRLRRTGLGGPTAARTYRLAGIGESQVAERLGETLLRATNPIVATYARVEAVDVRISATGDDPAAADALLEQVAASVLAQLGEHVWATGDTTWADAIGERLGDLGWTLAAVEIGTGGSLGALLGDALWVRFNESIAADAPAATTHLEPPPDAGAADAPERSPAPGEPDPVPPGLIAYARRARELGGADVGLAVRARPRSGDTAVAVSIVTPRGERSVSRLVFLTGAQGRSRAALSAASVLFDTLRDGG